MKCVVTLNISANTHTVGINTVDKQQHGVVTVSFNSTVYLLKLVHSYKLIVCYNVYF